MTAIRSVPSGSKEMRACFEFGLTRTLTLHSGGFMLRIYV